MPKTHISFFFIIQRRLCFQGLIIILGRHPLNNLNISNLIVTIFSGRITQILDYSITRENILNHLYMHPQLLSFNSQIFPALQQADSSAAQLSISQNLPILAP